MLVLLLSAPESCFQGSGTPLSMGQLRAPCSPFLGRSLLRAMCLPQRFRTGEMLPGSLEMTQGPA